MRFVPVALGAVAGLLLIVAVWMAARMGREWLRLRGRRETEEERLRSSIEDGNGESRGR